MSESRQVDILSREEVFRKAVFRIEEATFRHQRFSGEMSEEMTRLNLDRGDSVAALVYNHEKDAVVLTEQFRYPTFDKGPGWILELAAGIVEPDEEPAETMRRELEEEIGYVVHQMRPVSKFYLSPGGSSERIHLFFAAVTDTERTAIGGGVRHEGEDIRRVELPFQRALEMIESEEIMDAKTVIGLQWLQLHKADLFGA